MIDILTDERRAFLDALRDFAAREAGTEEKRAALTDHGAEVHSCELYGKLAELGYLGIGLPEENGGGGGSIVDSCLLIEEVHYANLPVAAISATLTVAEAVKKHAAGAIRDEVLTAICHGSVQSLGFSEPGAGSDLGSLRCKAEPVNGGYKIQGEKTWTSYAHLADGILLMARTHGDGNGNGAKHEGISMINVPTDTEGVDISLIDTLGGRETNDVFFSDAYVPKERLIGTENQGWNQLMGGLNAERLLMAAMFLGIARRAFDDALAYVKEREQFGQPIGSFQAIKHRLADLGTEIQCCRLLVYDTALQVEANPDKVLPREASMAKLKVTETARRVALEGMQMMGGYGYATEYGMEAHVRTALVGTIYGGTSEIQREIIGKTYGL